MLFVMQDPSLRVLSFLFVMQQASILQEPEKEVWDDEKSGVIFF